MMVRNTFGGNAHHGLDRGACGSTLAIHTVPPICFIEEHRAYLPMIRPFFEAGERGEFRIVTSLITLLVVLVHPD